MSNRKRNADKLQNNTAQTQILVLGPPNSGKDWLIYAFIKELELVNQVDNNFDYGLFKYSAGENVLERVLSRVPTAETELGNTNDLYSFQRRKKTDQFDTLISSHAHQFHLYVVPGSTLSDWVNNQNGPENVLQAVVNSENILLMLDTPENTNRGEHYQSMQINRDETSNSTNAFLELVEELIGKEQTGIPRDNSISEPQISVPAQWNIQDYQTFLQIIFNTITPESKKNVMVCMTKSDQLNFRGDSWEILQRKFGNNIYSILNAQRERHNIEIFNTSAVGYLYQNGKAIPNYSGSGEIREEDYWKPVGTTAPFFRLFEEIEKTRIADQYKHNKNKVLKKYIPYPKITFR